MKLFLVMSDTHGHLSHAKKVLEQYPQIRSVIHLGDYLRDAAKLQNQFPETEFIMVPGNCDYAPNMPAERVLELEGNRILLTHGHRYGVKSGMAGIESKAREEGFQAVLFGHTHVPICKRTSFLLLNPGSLGYPRGFSGPTYGILEISGNQMEARILKVSFI